MTPQAELMTEKEVAAALRVAPSTISRWVAKGLIAAVILPSGRRRFRAVDVARIATPAGLIDRQGDGS